MATLTPRQKPSLRNLTHKTSTPIMARKTPAFTATEDEIEVGDLVEVPGGMDGTVKFVGEVRGKPGIFVGVELSKKWASRGKNDGDAEGIRYFSTSVPGAGIFLPVGRAVKINSPTTSHGSIPLTPTTPSLDQHPISEHDEITSPPSIPPSKFSQSVSAIGTARSQSPFRPKSRPSIPRPESPVRRTQVNSSTTPGPRQSLNMMSQNPRLPGPPRFAASPTPTKMLGTASMRGSVRGGRPPVTPAANNRTTSTTSTTSYSTDRGSGDASEITQLQNIIAEKNAKIASLTAEFDAHRADFRSTLDTLELASTETERVYEKKVEDLLEERRVLMAQGEDVESVARQLRQLEEVVQELEEGLEDARRGEAEARGEVEFLRGEVERVRAELRRERERNVELVREVEDHRRDRARTKSVSKALNGSSVNGDESYSPRRFERDSATTSPSKSRSKALASPQVQQQSNYDGPFTPEPESHREASPVQEDPSSPTPTTVKHGSITSPLAVLRNMVEPSSDTPKSNAAVAVPAAAPQATTNDPDKWCALCEQDGHDSISCPLDQT